MRKSKGLSNYCLTATRRSPARPAASPTWPYHGGKAELLRVPYADDNALILPRDAEDKQNDYVVVVRHVPDRLPATARAPSG